MNFSKNLVKEETKDRNFLEKELKKLEKNLTNIQTNEYCLKCKQKLQNIPTKKVNGIRISEVNLTGTKMGKSQINSF